MKHVKSFIFLIAYHTIAVSCLDAQLLQDRNQFSRADSLRGALRPARTCYDVTHYDLDVKIDPADKSIRGSNTMSFKTLADFDSLQVDLFENMTLEKVEWNKKTLSFRREFNAIFIRFPKMVKKNSSEKIVMTYSGKPIVAVRPPWDGGFIWTKDAEGNSWAAVACQGTGASLWWPNKDHQADEPDSMMIRVTVPKGLSNISNGRLRQIKAIDSNWTRFDWAVTYPINNYNVTVNIGKFAHFDEVFTSSDGSKLTCDYYVMPENLEKAKAQFAQVGPMMTVFEKYFGKYPFYRDGYKLIESPHLGMEHQSAVAYGNKYVNGYRGTGGAKEGLLFDFIIIHESAHEWWGNAVGSKDVADMWIHEGFGNYSESIYIEGLYGYQAALNYLNGNKKNVRNDRSIIGPYDVNQEGSGDMYSKGGLMLNTLRNAIGSDSIWFAILRGIQSRFQHKTIHADSIFSLINRMTGSDYSYFFTQYLKNSKLPKLETQLTKKGDVTTLKYRWVADVSEFRMPIRITIDSHRFHTITPTTEWQTKTITVDPEQFKIDTDRFFIESSISKLYVDERNP